MIRNLYSIYDIKTAHFDSPFLAENDDVARRQFSRVVQSVQLIQQNPSDFELKYVGAFNVETGELSRTENVQLICNALNLMETSGVGQHEISNETSVQSGAEGADTAQ